MRVRRLIEWLYDTERSEREDCSNTCVVTRGRRNAQPSISRTRTRPTAVVLTTLVQARSGPDLRSATYPSSPFFSL
jgi:hypothetical protein